MTLLELIYNKPELILEDASKCLVRAHLPHYDMYRKEEIGKNLASFLLALTKCIEDNSPDEMIRYMDLITDERFASGFEAEELQVAINIFEESLWKSINKYVDEDKQYAAMKQVCCIIGKAKQEVLDDYAMLIKC